MKANKLIVNTKTGEERMVTFEFTPPPPPPETVSINPEKLIEVLIDKGIITSAEDLK